MTETAYQILFRGFDCLVAPTEEGMFHVTLFEEGSHVFDTDVPIDLSQFETDEEIDDNSDALINEAAQAAVDEFEAQRGSLGQGAGVGKMATKKTAYWSSMDYADWYCTLKSTAFKDQAESLLEQYFQAQRDQSCGNQDQAQARRMAEQKLAQLEYELNMLNLSRMKCAKPNETIIVIKAYRSDKEACGTLLEEFLDGFRGTKFEDSALMKMKEYLDVKKQLEALYKETSNSWQAMSDIQSAMDELYVNALQQEVSDSVIDDSGIGIDSNMAADVMSLMEGVTLDPMFEEQSEMPPALFASKFAQAETDPGWGVVDDHMVDIKDWANSNDFNIDAAKVTSDRGRHIVWTDPNDGRKLVLDVSLYRGDWLLALGIYDPQVEEGKVPAISETLAYNRSTGERWASKFAQEGAYMDEPERPKSEMLEDALAMVKAMRNSTPDQIKKTLALVYGLSDKDASDLVSYGKRGKRAQENTETLRFDVSSANLKAVKNRLDDLGVEYSTYPGSAGSSPSIHVKAPGTLVDEVKGIMDEMSKFPRFAKRAEKEDKENDGEYEVVELGQIHEGLDPAEVPLKDFPFAIGDKVTLSKTFPMPIWGGGTTELAKGTQGCIKSLYDGHGDAFMVTTEDGQTYCIPTDYLK